MNKNYFLLIGVLLFFTAQNSFSQNFTKQIIVCSGGNYSDPDDFVTVASYNPNDGSTTVFDTIYTQSVQHIICENGFAFVAAQDSIVKYQLDTYSRIAAVEAPSVHKLAVKGDYLVASFWYPATGGFVKSYSVDDLTEINTFNGISDEADGILIFPWATNAVVAVPGGWGATTGKWTWLDLEENELMEEYDLGETGVGISFFVRFDIGFPQYYAITKTPWGDSTFTVHGFDEAGHSTGSYGLNAALSGYTGMDKAIMFAQINGGIGQVDLKNIVLSENLLIDPPALSIAGSVYDSVNKQFYVTTTDFVSVGLGVIYNATGDSIASFNAGVSAEALAVDYRNIEATSEILQNSTVNVYPNPASVFVILDNLSDVLAEQIQILDVNGRVLIDLSLQPGSKKLRIDVGSLSTGLYIVSIHTNEGIKTTKFIKN